MPAKRTTVYLPDHVADILGEPDSLSGRIASIVIRYAEICRRHRPEFSRAEWCGLFDALNGTWLVAEHQDSDPARFLWAEIADSPGLGEKWHFDQPALVDKLRALPYAGQVSIVEHTTRFWQLAALPLDEALRQLGLPTE